MRVITVNLLNGKASVSHLERLLTEYDPDILFAQELAPNAGAVLERHFPHGVVKPVMDYRGKALVARTPIAVEEVEFPFRSVLRGELEDGLEVFNIHLANPIDGWRGRIPERRAQVRALIDLIAEPRPRVLAGDFNSTPAWPAYRALMPYVNDTVADYAQHHGTRPEPTWGWRPGWPAMLRIDHVLAHGLRAAGVVVAKMTGSDHKALIVDLEPA